MASQPEVRKVGFVFSGEGAKGAVQAGIAYSLYRKYDKPHYLTGVSSGALNAIGFPYLQPEGLCNWWASIDSIFDVFNFNWQFLWTPGLLSPAPLVRMLRQRLGGKVVNVEAEFPILDITTSREMFIDHRELAKDPGLLAAAGAIPGLVLPIDGKYVDAVSRCLAPLKNAIAAGCTDIYVILGRPLQLPPCPAPSGLLSSFTAGYRALDIAMHETIKRDIRQCLERNSDPQYKYVRMWIAYPFTTFCDALDFSRCKEGVDYGRANFAVAPATVAQVM